MKKLNFVRIVSFVSVMLLSPITHAGLGSYDYGYGVISKGMGGTGAADPEESMVGAINPAGLAFLTNRLDAGVGIIYAPRGYSVSNPGGPFLVAPGKYWSSPNYFVVPSIGYLYQFKDKPLTVAVSVYGGGGAGKYSANITGSTLAPGSGAWGDGELSGNLTQMFLNLGLAYKVNSALSFGGSLIPVIQYLESKGSSPLAALSVDPTHFTNTGRSTSKGVGYRLGLLLEPFINTPFKMGISYQPEISMSKFSNYSGALEDSGSLNVPPTAVIGLSYWVQPNLNFNFDTQKTWYQAVPAYGNNGDISLAGPPTFGTKGGPGMGWKNQVAFKLGVQWKQNDLWTWRAGFIRANSVVRPTQLALNFVGANTVANHYTVGFTRSINKAISINAVLMDAPKVTVTGKNPLNPAQSGSLFMNQYECAASLTWNLNA